MGDGEDKEKPQQAPAELAFFANLCLLLSEDSWAKWKSHSSAAPLGCASFFGDTHAGKSFILGQLISKEGGCAQPKVSEVTLHPTTAGVNGYEWKKDDLDMVLLDLEGTNAKTCPTEADVERLGGNPEDEEFQDQHNSAVSFYLPRLAYLVSDVLVYVTVENLAVNKCFRNAALLAKQASQMVGSLSTKPSLLIIANKSGNDDLSPVDELSDRFLDNHDPDNILKDCFHQVKCIELPYQEMPNFAKQLDTLAALLPQMVREHHEHKQRFNCNVSGEGWCDSFKEIIENLHDAHVSALCLSAQESELDNCNRALAEKLFRTLYGCSENQIEHFFNSRSVAIDYLALTSNIFTGEPQLDLEKLLERLDLLAPCGSVKTIKGKKYNCIQLKAGHDQHRALQEITGDAVHWSDDVDTKEKFNKPAAPKEQSAFQLRERFRRAMDSYKHVPARMLYGKLLEMWRQIRSGYNLAYARELDNRCCLCMHSRPTLLNGMSFKLESLWCGHKLCADCCATVTTEELMLVPCPVCGRWQPIGDASPLAPRVLSMDGGGIRGLLEIHVLNEIERVTGCQIRDLFDFIAGTSTGGIIALGLGHCGLPLKQMEEFYTVYGPDIFYRGSISKMLSLIFRHYRYVDTALLWLLKNHMKNCRLSSPSPIKVLTVATRGKHPHLFRSFKSVLAPERGSSPGLATEPDVFAWQAARATSAAPTYLAPFKIGNVVLEDGGLVANNPTQFAWDEAKLLWPASAVDIIVSLGTGLTQTKDLGCVTDRFLFSLLTRLASFIADTTSTHETALKRASHEGVPYYRLNPVLPGPLPMDATDEGNLKLLKDSAMECIASQPEDIREIAKHLLAKGFFGVGVPQMARAGESFTLYVAPRLMDQRFDLSKLLVFIRSGDPKSRRVMPVQMAGEGKKNFAQAEVVLPKAGEYTMHVWYSSAHGSAEISGFPKKVVCF